MVYLLRAQLFSRWLRKGRQKIKRQEHTETSNHALLFCTNEITINILPFYHVLSENHYFTEECACFSMNNLMIDNGNIWQFRVHSINAFVQCTRYLPGANYLPCTQILLLAWTSPSITKTTLHFRPETRPGQSFTFMVKIYTWIKISRWFFFVGLITFR